MVRRMYSTIKSDVLAAIPGGWEADHLILGLLMYGVALTLARRPLRSWSAVLPTLVLGVSMESVDVLVIGQGFADAVRDLGFLVIAPILFTFCARQGWIKL